MKYPTHLEVREMFDYKEDGTLIRKSNNKSAGCKDRLNYTRVKISGNNYMLHRIVWLYHFDTLPSIIDHIDGNPSNNRIENLRSASRVENMCNRKPNKTSTSRWKGVNWYPRYGMWVVRIQVNNVRKCIGYFRDEINAATAYNLAAYLYHGSFAVYNLAD